MFDIQASSSLPGVISMILGDREGTLIQEVKDPEGETTAAVSGFTVSHFSEAGDHLGLGSLSKLSLSGGSRASLVYVNLEEVLTVRVDPKAPLHGVEKKLDTSLGHGDQ